MGIISTQNDPNVGDLSFHKDSYNSINISKKKSSFLNKIDLLSVIKFIWGILLQYNFEALLIRFKIIERLIAFYF